MVARPLPRAASRWPGRWRPRWSRRRRRWQVGHRPADQDGRSPHGQGPEPVDDAAVEVGAQPHRRAHGRGRQVEGEEAGDGEVGVAAAAGEDDPGAEHVDEQQGEQHRLDGHVGELQRLPGDVDEVPAGEHQHVAQPRGRGRPGARGRRPWRAAGEGGRRHRSHPLGVGVGSTSLSSSSSVGWPVRAKNTSSSEGWWTSTSSTAMPAASRARTTVVARPEPLRTGPAAGGRRGSRGPGRPRRA